MVKRKASLVKNEGRRSRKTSHQHQKEVSSQSSFLTHMHIKEMFYAVASFLDAKSLTYLDLTCHEVSKVARDNALWKEHFRQRWPLFYEELMLWPQHPISYLPMATRRPTFKSGATVRRAQGLLSRRGPTHESHQVTAGWFAKFNEVANGYCQFRLQVYDREINDCSEFIMSSYDADVSYDWKTGLYRVLFLQLGKRKRTLEMVTADRLRLVPPSVRRCNPYYSIGGGEHAINLGLKRGDKVEVQWRLWQSHCFGWWFSEIESYTATSITFRNAQYSAASRWATVTIPWGVESIKQDPEGGQVGGLRKVDAQEAAIWIARLPAVPVF